MKLLRTVGATLAGLGILIIAFRQWRESLYQNMTAGQIADVETGALVTILGTLALVFTILFLVGLMRYRMPARSSYQDDQVIDAPALPEPAHIRVPRYSVNGSASPWGMTSANKTILESSTEEGGRTLAIPLSILQRFAELPTPARHEWKGRKESYSECAAFFVAHGLLQRAARNGFAWDARYDQAARMEWLSQIQSPTPSTRGANEAVF